MKYTLLTAFTLVTLSGCGGSDEPTKASLPVPLPETITLPNSPEPRPDITFDEVLIEDINQFVQLARSAQYFYPSPSAKDSDWSRFIAEGIVELAITSQTERKDKGLALIRQIAPYITKEQKYLPNIASSDMAYTWIQSAPSSTYTFKRALHVEEKSVLQDKQFAPLAEYITLPYGDEQVFFPLYLPTNTSTSGQTFSELGRWRITEVFSEPEVCMSILSGMWAQIQHFWPYFDEIEVNWQESLSPLLLACLEEDPVKRVDGITFEFTKLQDDHLWIYFPSPFSIAGPYQHGFRLALTQGKVLVTNREQGTSHVDIGDELISIDGQPIAEYITHRSLYSLRSQLHRHSETVGFIEYPTHQQPIAFKFEKANGSTYEYHSSGRALDDVHQFEGIDYVPYTDDLITELGEGLIKVNLYNINDDDARGIREYINGAKAVVLDARRYPRNSRGYHEVLSWFYTRLSEGQTFKIYHQGGPNQIDRRAEVHRFTRAPSEQGYRIPAIVLISRESQSANETLIAHARSGGLTLLGESTTGINGNIFMSELYGGVNDGAQGVYYVYTLGHATKINGESLINKGIQPDIEVPRTIESIRNGTDNQLEAAIQYLKSQL